MKTIIQTTVTLYRLDGSKNQPITLNKQQQQLIAYASQPKKTKRWQNIAVKCSSNANEAGLV